MQELQDAPTSHSESLSSLDSLENEVPQEVRDNNPACSNSLVDPSEVQDFRRPPSPLQPKNLCPSSDHFPTKSFLEEVLSEHSNSSSSSPSLSPQEDDESADDDQSLQDLAQATEQCSLTGGSQGAYTRSTTSCQNVQAQQGLAANSGHMAYCYDSTAVGNVLRDKVVVAYCKTQATPDTTPLEFTCLTQEPKLQGKIQEEKYAKHLSETGRCRHQDNLFQTSSRTTADVNTASLRFGNPALKAVESESSFQSCKKKPDGATVLQRETKPKDYEKENKRVDPSNFPNGCSDRTVATMPKSSKTPEDSDRTSNEPATGCSAPKCADVRFLKGILKKNSKFVVGDAKFTYTPNHFVFTKEVAMSIRDSMELAKTKAVEPENMKKKLRWFDEVNGNDQESEERIKKDAGMQTLTKNKPTHPFQLPSTDHQQELHRLGHSNAPRGISKTTSSTLDGPSSTRQAWADLRAQEDPTEEAKVQRVGPRVAGSRVPRRVRSAKTVSGPGLSRARKGTMIRPQSAIEAQRVVITQGKTMVPRPPPRSEASEANSVDPTICITKTAYTNDCPHSKLENPDSQPVFQNHVLKTDEGAIFAPVPPSHACAYETVSKGVYALCQPEAQTGNGRHPPQCGENGICLDRTPTDDEISMLWHGVRSALANKEGNVCQCLHSASQCLKTLSFNYVFIWI